MIRSNLLNLTYKAIYKFYFQAFLFINYLTKHWEIHTMRFKNLTRVYDFIQLLNIKRSHSAKNDYFPMHILLTIIYLLQEQKLNPNKYYEQENKYEEFCTSY
jgi:hypothetical protein